jgi:hypothetical protein
MAFNHFPIGESPCPTPSLIGSRMRKRCEQDESAQVVLRRGQMREREFLLSQLCSGAVDQEYFAQASALVDEPL